MLAEQVFKLLLGQTLDDQRRQLAAEQVYAADADQFRPGRMRLAIQRSCPAGALAVKYFDGPAGRPAGHFHHQRRGVATQVHRHRPRKDLPTQAFGTPVSPHAHRRIECDGRSGLAFHVQPAQHAFVGVTDLAHLLQLRIAQAFHYMAQSPHQRSTLPRQGLIGLMGPGARTVVDDLRLIRLGPAGVLDPVHARFVLRGHGVAIAVHRHHLAPIDGM